MEGRGADLTAAEIRVLRDLLRVAKDPLVEVAEEIAGEPRTNLYDHGAPHWEALQAKGFVMWQVDHWRLLDENAARRALAVEMLQEREWEPFRRLEKPFLVAPGVPVGLQISLDSGKKVSHGP
jgi:hypothetical protein